MKVADLIKNCALRIKDSDFEAVQEEEWKDILNTQTSNLYPDVVYEGQEVLDNLESFKSSYQIDLSHIDNIRDVKSVFVENKNGKRILYEHWIFQNESKILDLNPDSYKYEMDPLNYNKIIINWTGDIPYFESDEEVINLSKDQISLLEDLCVAEAINRTLNDRTKLNKYRTTTGQLNEYALLAILRDAIAKSEMRKRKISNSTKVRFF